MIFSLHPSLFLTSKEARESYWPNLGRSPENWKDIDLILFTLGRVPYLSFILGYFGNTAAIFVCT